jgi:hypothetical protein
MERFRIAFLVLIALVLHLHEQAAAQWVQLSFPDAAGDIRAFGSVNSNLFAGTMKGVYRSSNGGTNWVSVNGGGLDSNLTINCMATPTTNLFVGTLGGGIYFSSNLGATWLPKSAGLTNLDVRNILVMGSSFYAATLGSGVFVSTDNGTNWSSRNSGLTDVRVRCLSGIGGVILAGTNGGGIFKSTNYGQSWAAVNTGLTNLDIINIQSSGQEFFATTSSGVSLSSDYGLAWSPRSNGLTNLDVQDMLPFNSSLYAATLDSGVFVSSDRGTTWSEFNTELGNLHVLSLAGMGPYVFAGVNSGGLWRIDVTVTVGSRPVQYQYELQQNYPNPFNPCTLIRYTIDSRQVTNICVFDLLGREVAVLVNEEKEAGAHTVKFDGSRLASGVYLCRMQAGSFAAAKKILLLR